MRFKKAYERPAPTSLGAGRSRGRPDWMAEWLANQTQYMLMSCGHYEDLTYGHLLIIAVFGENAGRIVMCERCNRWVSAVRKATMHEFFGLPSAPTSEEPLF